MGAILAAKLGYSEHTSVPVCTHERARMNTLKCVFILYFRVVSDEAPCVETLIRTLEVYFRDSSRQFVRRVIGWGWPMHWCRTRTCSSCSTRCCAPTSCARCPTSPAIRARRSTWCWPARASWPARCCSRPSSRWTPNRPASRAATCARPTAEGHYLIEGNKVFISGGDQDFTANIVHLTLARIEGAPAGIKGVSLFAIPKKGLDGEDNDCTCAGAFHKMGWKGLPSIALNFGERGACRGWLVGAPHQGIAHMFQMMNEARLMVGLNAASTASAAYFESLEYAKPRPQGRPLTSRDPSAPQVPIVEHADLRP